ncbi:MAG: response regulator transcription factor [Agriterribacter sp.]
MILFESDTLVVNYFEDSRLLHSTWKRSPTQEEFVSGIREFKQIAECTPFITSLWNISKMDFVIPVELQKWVEQFLNIPIRKKRPHVKLAFVATNNLVSQLSVTEVMVECKVLKPLYFTNDNHALHELNRSPKELERREKSKKRFHFSSNVFKEEKLNFQMEIEGDHIDTYLRLMRFFQNNKNNLSLILNNLQCLTAREKDICRLIMKGLDNKSIGGELIISYDTVKTHRKNIFRKLKCTKPAELAAYSIFL